jgi:hypothetical protein
LIDVVIESLLPTLTNTKKEELAEMQLGKVNLPNENKVRNLSY